jgi:L-cysteine desulfidase
MDMHTKEKIIFQKLQSEFTPATGCTDPAAIACAVAKAREMLKFKHVEELKKIEVELSPNIFKNGYTVDIPGTSEKGIPIAAALGYIIGKSHLGFKIFNQMQNDDIKQSKQLLDNNKIFIREKEVGSELSIGVTIDTIKQEKIFILVKKEYLNVFQIEVNDEVIYQQKNSEENSMIKKGIKIKDIVQFIEKVSIDDLSFIADGLEMNQRFVKEGMVTPKGLKIGKVLSDQFRNISSSEDLGMRIRMMTATGVDARMGGSSLSVMSSAGSGNLGIGATVPLLAVADYYSLSKEKLIRGTALANLVHIYIKELTGKLTAGCGGVLVGMGTGAAIVWLLDGTVSQMEGAIKNVAANITGMICDGANYGCSLKVSTAAVESYYSAVLALKDCISTSLDGIVSDDIEQTIRNVALVYLEMTKLDPAILRMISGR